MTVREIPRQFKYICDACSFSHTQSGSTGHYTDSRPPGWSRWRVGWGRHKNRGFGELEGEYREILLCNDCSTEAEAAFSASLLGKR